MNREARYYDTPIGRLPSVTTILSVINKPYLFNWGLKEGREKTISVLWSLLEDGHMFKSEDELRTILKDTMKEAERKAQQAMDVGSLFHNAVEVYFKEWDGSRSEFIEFISEYYPEIQHMLETFFMVLDDNHIVIGASEQMVWHDEGFAGTLDCVALVDGELMIGDFKTSSRISPEYYLQTEAYRRAYNRTSTLYASKRFILRIDKTEGFDLKLIDETRNEEDWRAFKACLILYNYLKGNG